MVIAMALCALGAGTLATGRFRSRNWETDVAVAAAVGLVLFLWVPYLLARLLGIEAGARTALGILALLAVVGVGRIAVAGLPHGGRGSPAASRWPLLVVALLTVVVGGFLYNASLRVRDGNLCSAGGGCEDMGIHATLAHAFFRGSHEQVVRPTYPIFHGWPLGYPFLADFAAANGMALGAPSGFAFFASAAFALAAFMTTAWAVARRWLPPPSAALAMVLLFLGGNAGFVYFVRDLPSAGLAASLLQDYVSNWNLSLHYGNVATTILVPMRTSLFGAPMAFAIVALLGRRADPPRQADRLAVGVLLGSLPLVNAHAFLAGSFYLGVHILFDPIRRLRHWWPALVLAVILALPQLLWIRQQTGASAVPFIRLADGFLFGTPLSWPVYWLLNGGVFVPLGICAWAVARRSLRAAMLPLILLLPLVMAVTFQPNPYDNVKLLLFFQLGCAIVIADLCRRRAVGGRRRVLAAVAMILCTASGVLAWIREAQAPCVMATPEDRAFGDLVLRETDARSVVLTGQHYTHPVPFLAGRSVVLGFHNWLIQHGIPFTDRAADVAAIYAGAAAAPALAEKYGITHVVVGPIERREFPSLDEASISGLAVARWTLGQYTLFRLRR